MRRNVAAIVLLLAVGCSSGGPKTSVEPTKTAAPRPKASIDAREIDVEPLVAPHAVMKTVYADVDGDGIEEIAVWSQSAEPPEGSFIKQSYIDVFSVETGKPAKVFDAVKDGIVNESPDEVSQDVAYLSFVDFRGEGRPYLVLGIQNVGASNGPLDVWALHWDGGAFAKEFNYSTDRGGTLVRDGATLKLDTGAYAPGDPGCCPSSIAHIVIGYRSGRVQQLSRTETPTGNT